MKSRRHWIVRTSCALVAVALVLHACSLQKKVKQMTPQQVAVAWAELTLYVTKNTPANSPTYASRALGYIGVTMYESIVQRYPAYHSLAGQLNGLDSLPRWKHTLHYNEVLGLNAAQAFILKKFYNQTSEANKAKIDSLEEIVYHQFSIVVSDQEEIVKSVEFGKQIAQSIFLWSITDGGHRAYLHNFDKKITFTQTPGSWEPPLYGQSFSHYPLHPHWGSNRTFIKANAELPAPEMLRYNRDSSSAYYQQFISSYNKNMTLTTQEKQAALWWADDPGETYTPPGHSYHLATQVMKSKNPELIRCAETYARIGIAVADAFINCWKWKYHFFSERPSTFISKHIDERWEAFWPDPPFPAFPSGHATQAAAVATVLTDLYGEHFVFTDSTHATRRRDEERDIDYLPRSFTTFWQVAHETADSRFYGGIHTPQDNEAGLAEGSKVGQQVNALHWTKNK